MDLEVQYLQPSIEIFQYQKLNLFPPFENLELTIRRRSSTDPTLLNDSEMAVEGNDDLPVHDLRTMEELYQPSLNGQGGPIASIAIQATNFGLKNDMIQQSIKVNGVTDDALRLYLFPHSLTHHATAWFDRLPRNSINTFEQIAKMFLGKYFPPSMVTKLRIEITNFCQRPGESLFEAWERYKLSINRCPNHNMLPVTQIHTFYNGLTLRHRDTINAAAGGTFMKRRPEEFYDLIENMTAHHNDWDTSAQRSESSSSITSSFYTEIATLKAKMAEINKNLMRVLRVNQQVKAITPNCETYGGPHSFNDCPATGASHGQNPPPAYQALAYQALGYQALVHQPPIPQPQAVTTNEFTNFMKANDAILKNMQTNMTSLTNSNRELKNMFGQFMKMNTASSSGSRTLPGNTITNPKEDLKGITTRSGTAYQGPTIPTTSLPSVVERETEATEDMNKLSLPNLSPICMTLELTDHLISHPVGVAEDVFVKVGTFHFLADFVVVDFDADPRVPLILGRSFLKTGRDLIDVFKGELTLYVGKEAITFNLDQTSRYSANYNDMTTKRIDVIDMVCEEYSQEVLGFFDVIKSGNPTPYYDPIVSTTSSTLTPFGNNDFLLEEVDAFLALEDDPTLTEVDQSYFDSEGDILFLEAFLNDDPSLPPPNQGNYLPQVLKELKICEAKTDKSSIDEPSEVELKDLPPHLKYTFLEGDNKLPVIIVKYLSVKEKTALITILKSHKRAIAWKLSDIKGIDPEFCTHKILMEDYFEPVVQHQRRVNLKIHDVIKNEVLRLLDAGLIYLISDSPWLNGATHKDHFPLPFMDQMLERLAINEYYCFLDGFSRNSFQTCISHLEKVLKRCEDTNLCLNWEKSHFMVKDGIVLGHKISKNEIEVDKAKVDVISKLHHPTTVKGIRSFLGHAGFYRRFIKDFLKIAWPMTHLLEKDTLFFFYKECVKVLYYPSGSGRIIGLIPNLNHLMTSSTS
nr:reverse transcriptase domain-containing protein [Tanacetum cinerariifolium]